MKLLYRLTIAAILSFFVLTVHTQAEETYSKKHDWSGYYLGLSGDYLQQNGIFSTNIASSGTYFTIPDPTQVAAAGRQSTHPKDFAFGIYLGRNWQRERYVFGFEIDFKKTNLNGYNNNTVEYISFPGTFFTLNTATSTSWLMNMRSRVGYTKNKSLFYITAGLALSDTKTVYNFSDTAYSAYETATTRSPLGWSIGAGIEVKLSKNISLKSEFQYVDFGKRQTTGIVNVITPTLGVLAHSARHSFQIATIGISYHF